MSPQFTGIDHVHVYVASKPEAVAWYRRVLGLEPVAELAVWNANGGPLTLADASDTVHLALFEATRPADTTVAFGAEAQQWLAWKQHLENEALELRVTDHQLAVSMYFRDPWDNMYEITTYDHVPVRAALAG